MSGVGVIIYGELSDGTKQNNKFIPVQVQGLEGATIVSAWELSHLCLEDGWECLVLVEQ